MCNRGILFVNRTVFIILSYNFTILSILDIFSVAVCLQTIGTCVMFPFLSFLVWSVKLMVILIESLFFFHILKKIPSVSKPCNIPCEIHRYTLNVF